MLEYREKDGTNHNNKPPSEADRAYRGAGERPKFMSLAAQYGLKDMDIGNSNGPQQTIEQEYQAYITVQPPKDINTLRFWEVRNSINDISIYC
jgi:hypothetical protein